MKPAKELFCPLTGRPMDHCLVEKCVLYDPDAEFGKQQKGMCGINKLIRDIGEIRAKLK